MLGRDPQYRDRFTNTRLTSVFFHLSITLPRVMSIVKTWFQTSSKLTPSLSWLPPDDATRSSHSQRSSQATSPAPSQSSRHLGSAVTRSDHEDAFASFERSEAAVRRQLQHLLDAQAERLVAGIGQPEASQDLRASSIHTASPARYGKITPVRQPIGKPTSLRAARRGIRDSLLELAEIKQDELEACAVEIYRAERNHDTAADFEERQTKLWSEMEAIEKREKRKQRDQLLSEDAALQEQINIIEAQLSRLKDQRRAVRLQLEDITNSVDSKLSSYKQSIKLLESDISTFLRSQSGPGGHDELSYLALAPQRRTIRMAREHALGEKQSLQSRQQKAKEESEALHEGLSVWRDTMTTVVNFESLLRAGISGLGPPNRDHDPNEDMQQLLLEMNNVIEDLESKAKLAEVRGWKLLVCSIGAELEAFKQGRNMLRGVAQTVDQGEPFNAFEEVESVASTISPVVERSNQFDEPLRGSVSTIRRFKDERERKTRPARPEDDEPDSDLLVAARSDTDTEPE